MRRTIIATMFAVLAATSAASAQETAVPLPTPRPVTFSDVMRTCGAEWRESAERKATPGREAWNAYRAECLVRKGWAKKAAAPRADFVRVPDKS